MKKTSFALLGLAMAGMIFCSCKPNPTYTITVTGEVLNEGDTLFLTNDMGTYQPFDTTVVKDGTARLNGTADSVGHCVLYLKSNMRICSSLFLEPGNIKVILSDQPENVKVAGTKTNDAWQKTADSIWIYGKEVNRLATHLYQSTLSEQERKTITDSIRHLESQWVSYISAQGIKNINNELGFFILTNYDEAFSPTKWLAAVEKMPEHMRKRPQIQRHISECNKQLQTAEGCTMPDFQMDDINGKSLSILEEVKKNKLTIIDFWASWCGPCRQEMPNLVSIYKDYKAKGLGIIGISLDNSASSWKDATRQLGITWPQVSELKGWDNTMVNHFAVRGIPYTILVDSNGKILKKQLRGEDLREFVSSYPF